MERVEMALKNCSRTCDDFSVDDLLNFSNDDVLLDDDDVLRKKGLSPPPSENDDTTLHLSNDSAAVEEDEGQDSASLAVPMDDLAELEWLSNFVDDSSFTPSSAAPTSRKTKPDWLTGNRTHPVQQPTVTDNKPPLPVIIRTKRARTGVKGWSHLLKDSSSSSSSSDTSATPQFLSGAEFLGDPTVKRPRSKKKKSDLKPTRIQTQPGKCCCHCGVHQTPQWRIGPLGAKTLCNACGVRYKSGRLLPEYRPACSPTFSSELHSNSHRKVIEMRRKKEMEMSGEGDETRFKPAG